MKNIAFLFFCFSFIQCTGQQNIDPKTDKTKVYLLGTFHFAQTDSTYNVLDAEHQKSIKKLCMVIAEQKPEKVFVERQPEYEFQNKYDSLFKVFVKKEKLRSRNEIYQVGFRVAKMLGHSKVYQCDNPGMYGRYHGEAIKYAKEHSQMGFLNGTEKGTIVREDDLVNEDSLMHNSSLYDYIKWINSDAVMTSSHASYVANEPLVGSKDFYNYDEDYTLIGAEVTADWYRRNIMIYTKMISQLSFDEKAIFLIMGADHLPILSHLFNSNPHFEVIEAADWLR